MLQKLIDKRQAAIAAARAVIDADEWNEENYRAAVADAERYAGLISDEEKRVEMERVSTESRENIAEVLRSPAVPQQAKNQIEQSQIAMREFITPGSARKALRVGFPDELRKWNAPEKRATTDIVTTDAGTTYASYVVPTSIWDSVNMHVNAQSGVLKCNVTTIYTTGGNTIYIPTLTTDADAVIGAQGTAATQTDFVLAHPQLDAYRVDGWFGVSTEFLDDAQINAEAFLGDLAGRAIATKIATYAAAGTGSSQPQGVNDATEITGLGVTSASATSFTMDDLIELRYSVLPGYGTVGEWVFGDAAYLILAKMKNDEGSYLWQPSVQAGTPDLLMGRPAHSDADYQVCTSAKCPVTYGDMSNYWTRWSHGGIEFTRDDSFAFTSFEVTFRFAAWWDAELLHPTISVKHLLLAT